MDSCRLRKIIILQTSKLKNSIYQLPTFNEKIHRNIQDTGKKIEFLIKTMLDMLFYRQRSDSMNTINI